MAEQQRFQPALLNPSNTMRFTKNVRSGQPDYSSVKSNDQFVKSLLSFSDSFTDAFKAKYTADHNEFVKQQKIDARIAEEKKQSDILRGKFIREKNGVQSPDALNAHPEWIQHGYRLKHFELKVKGDNEEIEGYADSLADKIHAQWLNRSKQAENEGRPYVSLEQYGASVIENNKQAFLSDYEGDEVALAVLDKNPLNFNPWQKALAQKEGQRAKEHRSTMLTARVQRGLVDKIFSSHEEFDEALEEVLLPIPDINGEYKEGQSFYTKKEGRLDYFKEINRRLQNPKLKSTDPIFRVLDFSVQDPPDGVGFKFMKEYTDTYERLQKLEEELIEKEDKAAKATDEKGKEDQQKTAQEAYLRFYGRYTNLKSLDAANALLEELTSEETRDKFLHGTGQGQGKLPALQDKLRNDIDTGRFEKFTPKLGAEEQGKYNKIQTRLQDLLGKAQSSSLDTPETEEYTSLYPEVVKFESKEGGPELMKLYNDVENKNKESQKTEQAELEEITKKKQEEKRIKAFDQVSIDLSEVERMDSNSPDFFTKLTAVDTKLKQLGGKEARTYRDTITRLLKDKTSKNKQELFSKRGDRYVNIANEIKAKPIEEVTLADIQKQIKQLKHLHGIDPNKKEKALGILFDKLTEKNQILYDGEQQKQRLKHKSKIGTASRDKEELKKLKGIAEDKGWEDLMDMAQGYLDTLDTREYSKQVKQEDRDYATTKATKKQTARTRALRVHLDLAERLGVAVAEQNEGELQKIRKAFLSLDNQKLLYQAPNVLEMTLQSFADAGIKFAEQRFQKSTINMMKTAMESQSSRKKEAIRIGNIINQELRKDQPNFTMAMGFTENSYPVQIYRDGSLITNNNEPLFDVGTALTLQSKINLRKFEIETRDKEPAAGTSPAIHVDLQKKIRNFPRYLEASTENSPAQFTSTTETFANYEQRAREKYWQRRRLGKE